MLDTKSQSNISLNQIVGPDGKALPGAATSNVWVGTPGVFSRPTEGNKIKAFTTGKAYFKDLVDAINQASSEICIAGWQVNWDALLKSPDVRLYDVLLDAAKRGVRIYVMPWNDTDPVQTYDDQTKVVLEQINKQPGVKNNPVSVVLAESFATANKAYFSHHQKQVVVDRSIAYIGGIDICYGRYDDATYDLQADKDGREILNRYNGCVAPVLKLDAYESNGRLVDPDLMVGAMDKHWPPIGKSNAQTALERIQNKGWQVPYEASGVIGTLANSPTIDANTRRLLTLDPGKQPRMPWQDVHSRIEGPAVSDLLRNFVDRWAAAGGKKLAPVSPPASSSKPGGAFIQVLRSAPAGMRKAEDKAPIPGGAEDHIYQAMVQLIQKSSHFIYIENQFFVSDFGDFADFAGPTKPLSPAAQFIKDGAAGIPDYKLFAARKAYHEASVGDIDKVPQNKICAELIARIQRAILEVPRSNYHVYITIPVHPEGPLNDATVAVQVYWTMQTISFGKRSLLNGIRRALKARELRDKKQDYRAVLDDIHNTDWESIPIEKCFEYVTLLNVRNWQTLGEGDKARHVTEQVYIHTKLMIVDDRYALFGSANINDRSLLGERDSEIAVLVMDSATSKADVNGKGSQRLVRNFAHDLRINVWKKLFGITGELRAAGDLLTAIEAPGSPDSWRRIQAQATQNAKAYEAAFNWIPRDVDPSDPDGERPASILPVWIRDPVMAQVSVNGAEPQAKGGAMPFEDSFWTADQVNADALGNLGSIKGFFTALPVHWTRGENIHIKFPAALVTKRDESPLEDAASQVAQSDEVQRATAGSQST
jgi:phospholipase D1/2